MAMIDIDVSGLSAMQKLLDPSQFRKDVAAGLKYAIPTAKRTAAKEIGTKYAIPAARIKQDIKSIKYDDEGITFTFNRNPPSLRSYGGKPIKARTTKKGTGVPVGIKYRVFKGSGGTQKRDDAFWLQVGGLPFPGLPFRRKGPGSSGLIVLRGPSIGSIFTGKSAFGEQIRKATTEAVQVQFIKGVERAQSRRARGF
jgi:hypothetical protein